MLSEGLIQLQDMTTHYRFRKLLAMGLMYNWYDRWKGIILFCSKVKGTNQKVEKPS
jgi:hypothetical protein